MKIAPLPVFSVVLLLGIWCLISPMASGQFCDSITPVFNVDLSASPYQTWTSPDTDRDGFCCGASAPDKCLEFVITLHPDAAALVFNIASGAVPPGALFYQIDCGPSTAVGSPICLSGTGPFHLTFCKPGNNTNSFSIETIPNPTFGPSITLSNGCQGMLHANFYDETTVTWTSVTPGTTGAYNSFLNCISGCDSVYVTSQPSAPATVGYLVCGMAANGCIPDPVCDTIFTTFVPPIQLTFNAPDTVLCYDQTSLPVSVIPSGGTGPYSYLWDTGETTPGISASAGVHTVMVTDAVSCVPVQASITIVATPMPTVNAGADIDLCAGFIGTVTLNGTATNTSGILWTGGLGTFLDNTALSTEYYPAPSEANGGSVTLTLISNDTSGCPPVSDALTVEYSYVGDAVAISTTPVSCFGDTDGTATVNVAGIYGPYNYAFDSGAVTPVASEDSLAPGPHTVTVYSAVGCDSTLNYTIIEPAEISLFVESVTNVACPGTNGGSISIGCFPWPLFQNYVIDWWTIPTQFGFTADSLPAGNYAVQITTSNGCTDSLHIAITEPPALTLALSAVPPGCFGYTNGAVSAVASGGTGSYTYSWNSGQSSPNIYDIGAGNYSVTVTDSNACAIADTIVISEPPLLVTSISNDTVICPGMTASLAVTASGGTGSYDYLWSTGQNTPGISVSPSADHSYTCAISDDNNCSVTLDVQVEVETMDPDDISAQANPAELCLGETSLLTGVYSGPDPSVQLTWQHCTTCPAQTTVTPAATTTYTYTATNYCGQTIDAPVQVIVNSPPQIGLGPNSATVCTGETIQFFNTGTNNPQWEYAWDFGDGEESSLPSPSHSYDVHGVYDVSLTVTDNNGCSTSVVDGAVITVNPRAVAHFTTMSNQVSMLHPECTFYNSSLYATTYVWDFGDGYSATTFNAQHLYDEENFGFYEVQLFANNPYDCPDSATMTVEVVPSFDIYVPNAFTPDGDNNNQVFSVKGYGLIEEGFSMVIYDRWGEILFESMNIHVGWDGTYHGKVVQDGVYTWVISYRDLTDARHQIEGHVTVLK